MFQSLAIVSLVATSALAINIPTGISSSCSDFLTKFASDTSLKACTSNLASATAQFGTKDGQSASKDTISSALTKICSTTTDTACSESAINDKLSEFQVDCSAELTNPRNEQVVALYDTLYVFQPLRASICSKDDGGNYCVLNTANNVKSTPDLLSSVQQYLSTVTSKALRKRANGDAPNFSALGKSYLPFLFANPDLDEAALCTTCTRNVVQAYREFQKRVQYAVGTASSPLLQGQYSLTAAIKDKCPSNFLTSGSGNAGDGPVGGIKTGSKNGAESVGFDFVTLMAGVLTTAFAVL